MQKGLVQGSTVPREWTDLVEPHVESVNYFLSEGLAAVVAGLKPVEVREILDLLGYALSCKQHSN